MTGHLTGGRRAAGSRIEGMSSPGAISREDVAQLARLARLRVTDAELATFAGQLEVILASVRQVAQVAAENIPPTSHSVPLTNVFRADVIRPSLDRDEVLAAAPAAEDGRFRVPRMLDDPA